jgi:ferrous-iron efflux pump FieF
MIMTEAAPRTGPAPAAGTTGAEALMRRASYASVAAALLLIAAKLFAYLLTDSVSLLSSLLDSALDAAASLLTMLTVRQALVPADREHRFGHGKAEPLGGLAQSAFIAGSAIFLIVESANRLTKSQPVENTDVGIAVMVLSIVVSFALVAYQRYVIRRTRSVAIKADSLHYLSDLIINGSVIVALVLIERTGWRLLDPLFAIGIALFIMWTSWRIAREMLDMLMDRELPDADRQRIRAIATSHPGVAAVHDLRTRAAGRSAFVQIHLEMDGAMPLRRAHEIADEVEAMISAEFPGAEVITHQDPVGVSEARADSGFRRAGGAR